MNILPISSQRPQLNGLHPGEIFFEFHWIKIKRGKLFWVKNNRRLRGLHGLITMKDKRTYKTNGFKFGSASLEHKRFVYNL